VKQTALFLNALTIKQLIAFYKIILFACTYVHIYFLLLYHFPVFNYCTFSGMNFETVDMNIKARKTLSRLLSCSAREIEPKQLYVAF